MASNFLPTKPLTRAEGEMNCVLHRLMGQWHFPQLLLNHWKDFDQTKWVARLHNEDVTVGYISPLFSCWVHGCLKYSNVKIEKF